MARFGFVGSSYALQSTAVDAEYTMNWYQEFAESPGAKTQSWLAPAQGKQIAWTLSGPSVRGMIKFQGLVFAVSGSNFYQLIQGQPAVLLQANIASDNNPVSMTAGPNQILFAAAGTMYVWNFKTSTFTVIPQSTLAPNNALVSQVGYIDGFFICTFTNTGQYQVSNPDDATTWPLLSTAIVSVFPDNINSMVICYRQVFFFGGKQTAVYYDAGTAIQPLAPSSGGFIETGSDVTYGSAFMDGSPFWIGSDDRGQGIAWRSNGYNPVRVSNFATEYAWSQYPTLLDAISFTWQDQGHTFWQILFPSANATWLYDAATGAWHQRGAWTGGNFTADHARCHVHAFGNNYMGDWASGNVYQQSIGIYTDNGNPIRRVRRSATIATEKNYLYHYELQLDMDAGLGPIPPLLDGQGNPREPQVFLRWSDNGSRSWSNEHVRGTGQAGDYRKRVLWQQLGRSRNRIYELSCSDPVPYRIGDAYIKASPAYDTAERYQAQLRKVS